MISFWLYYTGAHTIGQARCVAFRNRIYNESNIESSFAKNRRGNCPRATGSGDNNLAPLDFQSPNKFDNQYYKHLLNQKGLLHSDQILFNGGSTDSLVSTYASNSKTFNSDFAAAMIKMGDISPLTGSSGEIRKNCRRPNWWWREKIVIIIALPNKLIYYIFHKCEFVFVFFFSHFLLCSPK